MCNIADAKIWYFTGNGTNNRFIATNNTSWTWLELCYIADETANTSYMLLGTDSWAWYRNDTATETVTTIATLTGFYVPTSINTNWVIYNWQCTYPIVTYTGATGNTGATWLQWQQWFSAYDFAVASWFTWTELEWINSLKWTPWFSTSVVIFATWSDLFSWTTLNFTNWNTETWLTLPDGSGSYIPLTYTQNGQTFVNEDRLKQIIANIAIFVIIVWLFWFVIIKKIWKSKKNTY